MSAIRHLVRAAIAGVAALVATGTAAAPAYAADASVELARLPTRMTAGGEAAPLVGTVRNTSRNQLGAVQVTFVIQMSGLDPDEVSIDGLDITEQNGRLRATERIEAPAPGRSTAVSHQLQFLEGAPKGRATVTMAVYLRRGDSWRQVDSARTTTTVVAAPATPSEEPSPEPTEQAAEQPTEQPSPAGDTRDDVATVPRSDDGAPLWPLYMLGLLLVAGGGGVVAMLLLRRNRDGQPAYVAGYGGAAGYAEPGAYAAGYPGGAYPNPAGYSGGAYPGPGGQPGPGGYSDGYPTAQMSPGAPRPPYAPTYDPPTTVMPETPTMIMPPVSDPPEPGPRGGRHRSED